MLILGLSFCFMKSRKLGTKKSKRFPVFVFFYKIKTKA